LILLLGVYCTDVVSFTDVSEAYAAFLIGIEVVRVDGKLKPSPCWIMLNKTLMM
jgi:hypothetical protein